MDGCWSKTACSGATTSHLSGLSVAIFLCVGLAQSSFAIPGTATVTDLETQKPENLSSLIMQLDDAIAQASPTRRDFESVSAFEQRQKANAVRLNRLLERKFRLSTAPDDVKLDWENSSLTIVLKLPIQVHRERGGSKKTTQLSIVVPVEPAEARVISSFPNEVLVHLDFRLSSAKALLLKGLRIMYHSKEIYR